MVFVLTVLLHRRPNSCAPKNQTEHWIPACRITVWGTVSLPRWRRTNSNESRYPLRPNSNSSGTLESVKTCWLRDTNL